MAFNVITSTRDHVKPPLLEVCGLRRRFGGVVALDGLGVGEGTITALIGPNGAGKTTAFQCISGVALADAGAVRFAGRDVTGWRPCCPKRFVW
jgi:ABC-type branched-subunit amino acid transport system ATPase component